MCMRSLALSLAIVLTAVIGACGESESPPPAPETKTTFSEVKEKTAQAIQTATRYASEQSEALMKKMQTGLKEFEKDMDALEAEAAEKMQHLSARSKEKWRQARLTIDEKRKTLDVRMENLKNATREEWEDAKRMLDQARQELKDAYEDARSALQ